jgi:hypothetical protein
VTLFRHALRLDAAFQPLHLFFKLVHGTDDGLLKIVRDLRGVQYVVVKADMNVRALLLSLVGQFYLAVDDFIREFQQSLDFVFGEFLEGIGRLKVD